jgi:hypothetical protein
VSRLVDEFCIVPVYARPQGESQAALWNDETERAIVYDSAGETSRRQQQAALLIGGEIRRLEPAGAVSRHNRQALLLAEAQPLLHAEHLGRVQLRWLDRGDGQAVLTRRLAFVIIALGDLDCGNAELLVPLAQRLDRGWQDRRSSCGRRSRLRSAPAGGVINA